MNEQFEGLDVSETLTLGERIVLALVSLTMALSCLGIGWAIGRAFG